MSTKNLESVTANEAKLIIGNKEYILPIKHGTEGPSAINIEKLLSDANLLTLDPGFMSTASCESSITFIDGDKGILRHRGYAIEELATESNFLEVCWLLLNGELPNKEEYDNFVYHVTHHSMVHEQLHFLLRGFPADAHPMAIMEASLALLSALYHETLDIHDPAQRAVAAYRIIAKMPTLAAMAYKYSIGQPFIYPRNDLGYAENFLHMMFALPSADYKVNPVLARAMDRIFILHADHEQNASTSTVRLAGSSGANPLACIGAGIASLWGPAHGGANEAVLKMLKEIGSIDKVPAFIEKVKDKSNQTRLMGFGHRVYKNHDPRATVLRETCREVLEALDMVDHPLLKIAVELERIALADPYFIERKLYPNVDFYSGIIYKAIGIPEQMFTVIFALARSAGWIAQWKEMIEDPRHKIGRPRQVYLGYQQRSFTPLAKRKKDK